MSEHTLTDAEQETLNDLWVRDDFDGACDLLASLLAARDAENQAKALAPVLALADEWETWPPAALGAAYAAHLRAALREATQ